jgi:hypothetical protein
MENGADTTVRAISISCHLKDVISTGVPASSGRSFETCICFHLDHLEERNAGFSTPPRDVAAPPRSK